MLALKVPLKHAQEWKKYLIGNNLLNREYRPEKEDGFINYPLKKHFKISDACKSIGIDNKTDKNSITIEDLNLQALKHKGTLKDHLTKKLTPEELIIVKTAHDTIGEIAVLEIPKDLEPREDIIAKTLLENNKRVTTVLKKAASHEGTYRTQKMTYLAGINTKEALHKENGCKILLDVEKVYFSVRLSTERKRIAELVRDGEDVLVMFSGCGVYPIVISKNSGAKSIVGIEINPDGHKYALENIKINKTKNIVFYCGDVKDVVPRLSNEEKRFDRIIMPLPKTADQFLDEALSLSKSETTIHFYDFLEDTRFDDAVEKISRACKKNSLGFKILQTIKCGQHSPHVFRICVDFIVLPAARSFDAMS